MKALKWFVGVALVGLLVSGCSTIEKQVASVMAAAEEVGAIEYSRTGLWTDSELTVTVNEDGSKNISYEARTKAPGGPKVSIKVEGVQAEAKE